MQRLDKVLDGSCFALMLVSEREGGRLWIEWTSPALSALAGVYDTGTYVHTLFDSIRNLQPNAQIRPFVIPRVDTGGVERFDRVSGRCFAANGARYWVVALEDAQAITASAQERAQLLDRITTGGAAVQGIIQVTEAMRAEVTLPNAVETVPPVLVPAMAQWVTVQVVNPNGDGWAAGAAAHEEGAFSPVFRRYVGSLLPAQLRHSSHNTVLTGRLPFVLANMISESELDVALPSESAKVLAAMSLGSTLTVPLLAGESIIGTMVLARSKDRTGFTEQEVEMVRLLGRRVGNALRAIERAEARRQRAITVQNALLPELPAVAGVEALSVYRPSASYASVGGDWYDLISLADGALGLSIGDVCGHDTGSMAAMASYRWTIHTYLWQGQNPAAALDLLDRQLGSDPEFPQLATAVVVHVDRADPRFLRLSYTSAGHPAAVVICPDGRLVLLKDATSMPIGITPPNGSRPVRSMELPYGSTLVLFTDGVVERRDVSLKERIGALHEALRSVGGCARIEDVRDALLQLNSGYGLEDDMSFLIANIGPRSGSASLQSSIRSEGLG